MTRHHDVIVIGAGLGGLSAAAKLSRAGLGVHLLERHVRPGGYATSFRREQFEFEVSLHEISGIGTPASRGSLWTDLDQLDVASRVEFLPVEHLFRSLAPNHGLDLRLPAHPEGALETLLETFPHERDGLNRLFSRFRDIQLQIRAMGQADRELSPMAAVKRFPVVSHAATVPLSALLYKEVEDPLARLAVGQLWSFFGLPPERLSAVLYVGGLTAYLTHGANYIKGTSQALSNAFCEVIEEAGGQISLGHGVKRILCQDGKVTGVITDEDEHLTADVVVANANPVTVAMDLVGAEHLPRAFLGRMSVSDPSISTVCVHLGLSRTSQELGMEDYEIFVNGTVDMEQQYRDACVLEPCDTFLITSYSVIDPEFSPPGTSAAVLVGMSDGHQWKKLPPREYPEMKRRFAENLVEQAGRIYPGLPSAVEVDVVSTPLTNMRYTGNVAGAIYGFANTPAHNPAFRMEQRGPLEGLWFASAWTRPGGGFEPTFTSGLTAADAILTRWKP